MRGLDLRVVADELRSHATSFLSRRWLVADGYLTSILVSVLDSEEEIEIEINEDEGFFCYRSPDLRTRLITRPLSEIAIYAINLDVWLDEMTGILGIEQAHRARQREVLKDHLWHLGNLRVGRTHQLAPVYVARRLTSCNGDWRKVFSDSKRLSHGIVITALDQEIDLPNGHQACSLHNLLISTSEDTKCDLDMLNRMLEYSSSNGKDEYFDERSGALQLACFKGVKIFKGKQKAVIALF